MCFRDLLHGLSCFKEIDEKALTQLAGRLLPLNVPPGHEVVRQGDPADSLFILEVQLTFQGYNGSVYPFSVFFSFVDNRCTSLVVHRRFIDGILKLTPFFVLYYLYTVFIEA